MKYNTFANAIKTAIRNTMREDLNTSIPAIVTKIEDKKKRIISVKPAIGRVNIDGVELEYPEITNVPYIVPSGGGCSISIPVSVGDSVLLIFSMNSLDKWILNGEDSIPNDNRRFDLSDAIAIVGLSHSVVNNNEPENKDFGLYKEDKKISINEDNTISIINGAGSISIDASGQINMNNSNLVVLV